MKTTRLIFSVLSVLIAGVASIVNAQIYFATMYYRAPDINFNTPGARCGVVVPFPCVEAPGTQCAAIYTTLLPGETAPSPKIYYISKSVDAGPCQIVTRAL